MKFGNQDGTGFGFGSFGAGQTQAPPPDEVEPEETTAETTAQAKRAHRRTKECTELSQRYEYRRAFSDFNSIKVRLEQVLAVILTKLQPRISIP